MADWAPLLDHLAAGPREDDTLELAAAAQWLFDELTRRTLDPQRFEWLAHPWRLRTVGVAAVLGAAVYSAAVMKRWRALALAVTLAVPAYVVLELDYGVPLLGPLRSTPEQHLMVTVPPTGARTARLVFSAHYDTKTDLLDHVERAPVTFLALPLTLLMLLAALLPRLRTLGIAAALLNGGGQFLVQTGGAFVPDRSPGAVDDGASCAVLIEVASALKAQPLSHTEVQVVFFSGEEIGIEGAREWVRRGLDRALPTRAINLDGVGASPTLALYSSETGLTRRYRPDPALIQQVEAVTPLARPWYPATTDARAFLEAGIPALNLSSEPPGHGFPRGMHSRADARSRVDLAALDGALNVLTQVARRLDSSAPSL